MATLLLLLPAIQTCLLIVLILMALTLLTVLSALLLIAKGITLPIAAVYEVINRVMKRFQKWHG